MAESTSLSGVSTRTAAGVEPEEPGAALGGPEEPEGSVHGVLDALALVTLVGADAVRKAADAQSVALHGYVFGTGLREYAFGGRKWDELVASQEAYRRAVQEDLQLLDDTGPAPSPA